jgi:hypothetical protein
MDKGRQCEFICREIRIMKNGNNPLASSNFLGDRGGDIDGEAGAVFDRAVVIDVGDR